MIWSLGMAPMQPSLLNNLKLFIPLTHAETSAIFSGQALGDLVPFSAYFLLQKDPTMWLIVETCCVINFAIVVLLVFTMLWAYLVVKRMDGAGQEAVNSEHDKEVSGEGHIVNTHVPFKDARTNKHNK